MIHVHVFADRREDYKGAQGPHLTFLAETDDELDSILKRMAQHDWHFPVHIVWRGREDTRWSYMTLMEGQREGEDQ